MMLSELLARGAQEARAIQNDPGSDGPGRKGNTNEMGVEYLAPGAQQQAGQQGAGKKENRNGLTRGTHGAGI